MSDIVERLRAAPSSALTNWPELTELAADAITTLRDENERLRALLDEPSEADILAAADVAEAASCPGREGPYGLYNYSNYPGTEEPHVIRDFRTLKKGEHGATVARFATRKAAEAEYMRLQKLHVMGAAISAYLAAIKERVKP